MTAQERETDVKVRQKVAYLRRVLTIALFFIATIIAVGQDNAVYASFAPQDNGIGIRVDMDGGYMSMAYGNYKLPYGGYINDHLKLAIGGLYKGFSFGLTYHDWGETSETVQLVKRNLRHLSFELGGGASVGRFVAALRYDVLRNEGTIDFGIRF